VPIGLLHIYNRYYEVIQELDLPDGEDEHILIDELIFLTGAKGLSNNKLIILTCSFVVFLCCKISKETQAIS